jgi:hypothetical protein
MIELTNQLIRDFITREGYSPAPSGKLGILGLRGAFRKGETQIERNDNFSPENQNHYNDTLVLYGPVLAAFPASCDPGRYWTERPLNLKGCAHLKEGAWFYRIGVHKGHQALVQDAAVTIVRDFDKDGKPDPEEPEFTGWFGINIHAGGTSPEVNRNSAGCQVIEGGWEGQHWQLFFSTILFYRNRFGQTRFNYHLLKASRIF